jgi:hypothetical protein
VPALLKRRAKNRSFHLRKPIETEQRPCRKIPAGALLFGRIQETGKRGKI